MPFFPTEVNLYHTRIHNPDNGCRIRVGTNVVVGLSNMSKKTQGFGQQYADFAIVDRPEGFIDDSDKMDSNRTKGPLP
ncbi:hypothetical protein ACFFK0_25455 [Paenibacillus chartarius]|uniref:Uncharacterized protein n=1 Tax=Paenibacillus chartarius TaxID=747481 RepID=A0ABV6DT86_9BACL